ncbi:hypothetical protein AA313_de0208843 [Arthrobotrys entomopaga]|nr:hypothetical protein AA313_de0208843 [Arthrobotrys entomopaga]
MEPYRCSKLAASSRQGYWTSKASTVSCSCFPSRTEKKGSEGQKRPPYIIILSKRRAVASLVGAAKSYKHILKTIDNIKMEGWRGISCDRMSSQAPKISIRLSNT